MQPEWILAIIVGVIIALFVGIVYLVRVEGVQRNAEYLLKTNAEQLDRTAQLQERAELLYKSEIERIAKWEGILDRIDKQLSRIERGN